MMSGILEQTIKNDNVIDKKIKTFASNRSAVSIMLNYIIVFSISIILFGIVILLYGNHIGAMVGNYQQAQYTQVGSMVADSIVGLYLTGTMGEYSKMIDLPTPISGQGYRINVTDDFLGQRSVKVYSNDGKTVVYAPLNNIDKSVTVEGMVYSSSGLVKITYNNSLNSIVLEQG